MIGDNEPYDGRVPMGYSQIVQGQYKNVEMALIEIRQDLVADLEGQSWAAKILFDAVRPFLNHETI